jgi:hypothetical protein
VTDRRHGYSRRSDSWRDPEVLVKVEPELRPLCAQIADLFDQIELRSGPVDRRKESRQS